MLQRKKALISKLLTLIRESWKKSKTRDRHRARFAEKKSRAQRCIFCICSCALEFFPESALGDGPKNSWIRVKLRV